MAIDAKGIRTTIWSLSRPGLAFLLVVAWLGAEIVAGLYHGSPIGEGLRETGRVIGPMAGIALRWFFVEHRPRPKGLER